VLELALRCDGAVDVFLLKHEEDGDAGEVEDLLCDGEVGWGWCYGGSRGGAGGCRARGICCG
jgi:hypothetical protein